MKKKIATLIALAFATPLAAQWLSLPTPGIPRTADGKPNLSAPVPRIAGRPDLTGLWRMKGTTGDLRDETKLKEWARTAMAQHEKNYYKDGSFFQCLPAGPGYIASGPAGGGNLRRIVQSPTVTAILNADLTYRQIFTDGRALEEDPLPIWMGYSVGHWDGDTLVVESNGYNDKTWLHANGLGHTDQLRITERYHRTDFGHMTLDVTYKDPGTFESPLHAVIQMEYGADDEMLEIVCNEATEGSTKQWDGKKDTDALTKAVTVEPQILSNYIGRYEGIWLDNPTRVDVTLENGALFLSRNGGKKSQLLPQSETAFVCPTCTWGQPYVFTRGKDGALAPQVAEVQISGAWVFKRVK
jgi:hypothetical protein